MKCPRCHGTGKITEWVATDTVSEYEFPCRKCNGTGEIEVTNEEWFCQLPTEEKADFLANSYPKSVGEALIKISNGDKEMGEVAKGGTP